MKLLVLNPTTGFDAAPGDHPQRAVKTCTRLNSLIAALSGACCDIIIDTSDTPASAPFLALDATIQLTQPSLAVYGIGHRNVGRSAPQPVPSSGYADILDAKILTSANFVQPNAATYPNVWSTTDTELKAGFSELRGWTGNSTPLKVYSRVRVSTQAAALPLVNATAGTCWTDGTTMLFHPSDGTNPTTNGKTYVRSRPSTHFHTSPGASVSPLMVLAADDVRVTNVALGGSLACDYTGGTDVDEYVCLVSPQGTGRTITIDGMIAHSGSWHLLSIVDETLPAAVNGNVTVKNSYWSNFDPTSTSSTEPFAVYYGYSGATGNTVTFTNVKHDDAVANGSSLFTHGGTNAYDMTVNYPQFTSPISSAAPTCRNLRVIGSVAAGSTVGSDGDTCKISCLTAYWQGIILGSLPSNSQTTNPNTLRGCLIRPVVDAPGGVTNAGNIDVQFCTFDVVNTPGGSGSTPSMLNAMAGANTINFSNNVVLGASSKDFDLFLLAPNQFTIGTNLTLTADHNQYVFRVNFGTMFAVNGTLKTPAQWVALGLDTHSVFTYVGLATEALPSSLGLGTDYFPLSTSAILNTSASTAGTGDAMGQTYDLRKTPGMYEYWARDSIRGQALLPLPPAGNFATTTVGDLLGAMLDDRIALGRRIATIGADLGAAAGSLSASDPAAQIIDTLALSGPQSVTLSFVDANSSPVPNVPFALVGLGSGRANASGIATFGAQNGTYTVTAAPTSGMLFANTSLTVNGTTNLTIQGAAQSFVIAPPGSTTVYLTTRDQSGTAVSGVVVNFQINSLPAGAGAAFNQSVKPITSDGNGLVQIALPIGAGFSYWTATGQPLSDTVPASGPYALQDLLGSYS